MSKTITVEQNIEWWTKWPNTETITDDHNLMIKKQDEQLTLTDEQINNWWTKQPNTEQ